MSASVVGIEKPVVIDRKQNLREHRLYWVGRRTQDVVLSALALVVLSPVMLATAVAIVVDDPSATIATAVASITGDSCRYRGR